MESKLDETKNNLLQSKYPPDIIGFCEAFFMKIFQMTLNINGTRITLKCFVLYAQ
jgi:hypothetical protein